MNRQDDFAQSEKEKEPKSDFGRKKAFRTACNAPPGTVGSGICYRFKQLYFEQWPECMQEIGNCDVGKFYDENKDELNKPASTSNCEAWGKKETEFFQQCHDPMGRLLAKGLSASQRGRLVAEGAKRSGDGGAQQKPGDK